MDDFFRFTWVLFVSHKNEAFIEFSKFCKKTQKKKKKKDFTITCIRNNYGVNLKIMIFKPFVNIKLKKVFYHLKLLNKMALFKERIKFCKKWKESCLMKTVYQNIFRPRQLILHIMF